MIGRGNRPDLWFTTDGDFIIDDSGDLKDTGDSDNVYESLRQSVVHRLLSNKSGWRLHPQLSAGLDRFIGKTVNALLLERMRFEVASALTLDGILVGSDFTIFAEELLPSVVLLAIYINTPGQNAPLLSLVYNVQYGSVIKVK